jgi:hypothetical protein
MDEIVKKFLIKRGENLNRLDRDLVKRDAMVGFAESSARV